MAHDERGNVESKKDKRLCVVKASFADGHGPLRIGQAYWFDEKESRRLEKAGLVVPLAAEVVGHLKTFGVVGIVVNQSTDKDVATLGRKAGLEIEARDK